MATNTRINTLPETFRPFGKTLEDAGIPIEYGPSVIPAPSSLSETAKAAWSQLPSVPMSSDNPARLNAARQVFGALENIEYQELQHRYSFEDETINGVTVMWVTPPELEHEEKLMVFIHGGGYVLNTRKTQLALQASVASRLGVRVASVEYPLAPENPYPAALNAVVDAYQGLLDRYNPSNIGMFGSSAGGGITLAALLRLKSDGVSLPAASAPLSPAADMTLSGDFVELVGNTDPILQHDDLVEALASYVGNADPSNPFISPVFGDYTDVTPLFLLAGTHEMIASDAIRTAAHARRAGCEVTLIVLDGMWHVPIAADGSGVPELQHAFDELTSFFRRHLHI